MPIIVNEGQTISGLGLNHIRINGYLVDELFSSVSNKNRFTS